MAAIYTLIGFNDYIIKDKILYRKARVIKSKSCVFQYRNERKIKISIKNGNNGYYLERNGKTKFYPLKKLRHRLKKIAIFSTNPEKQTKI